MREQQGAPTHANPGSKPATASAPVASSNSVGVMTGLEVHFHQHHVACPQMGHLPGQLQQPNLQQLTCEPGGGPQMKPECPESRSLYKQLVSQLSLAACEAQLEHMGIRSAPSNSSTCSTFSAISRDSSISGPPSELSSRPGSTSSTASPISTDAFQSLLFRMLEEEWAAHTQGPITHRE